ncbi:MAG: AAA family ATPase [Saprospiraceae bacterium]
MKLIIISGPPAVGKMTVGRALAQQTSWKLFHNHMSLELVNQFFDFGTPSFSRLDKLIRFGIFAEVAKSNIDGLIFTIVTAYNEQSDLDYLDEIIKVFENRNPEVLIVDLSADLEERLKRNKNPERIKHKPSKSDMVFSEKALLSYEKDYRMNSSKEDLPGKKVLRINNTYLSPEQVAHRILEHL